MAKAFPDCDHHNAYTYYDAFYKVRLWECPSCTLRERRGY